MKHSQPVIDRVLALCAAGLSHSEIATVMGMKRSVISGLVHRGTDETQRMRQAARRAGQATRISLWLNDPNRPKPSLPHVKWLERPDP